MEKQSPAKAEPLEKYEKAVASSPTAQGKTSEVTVKKEEGHGYAEARPSPAENSTETAGLSKKHVNLIDNNMGNKGVQVLPGVGPAGKKALNDHGIDKAYKLYDVAYLQNNKNPEAAKKTAIEKGVRGEVYADRLVDAFKDLDIRGKKPSASKTSKK